ncbi:MAG: DUF2283 domain-containing protein [Bacteroidales bacterium]|nr:DUF2283 domain-containing protein [Bacteroidales bacterium]
MVVYKEIKSGASHISFDFDEEADTLYISFEKPQNATDTDILEDGTFLRIRDDKIVGITITNFSQKYQHA